VTAFRDFGAGVTAAGTRFHAEITAWTTHIRPLANWGGLSTDAWTAVGTIAAAAVTFVTLMATIVISWRSNKKLRKERDETLAAEQLAEAYQIQIIGDVNTVVVNHGKYTITHIEAWLAVKDGPPVAFPSRTRVLQEQGLAAELLRGVPKQLTGTKPGDHSDTLAPWDAGLRFAVDAGDIANLANAYPVVHWTDRWDNRWEHRLGHVNKIEDRPRRNRAAARQMIGRRRQRS
jgi:hypothetical protein